MNYKGLAFFEVGIGQMYAVKKIFSKRGFKRFSVWRDLSGIERVLCVKKDA